MSTSSDFIRYQEKMAALSALRIEALPLNKTALFDALAAAGIDQVVVEFDGSGDSGQIENVAATVGDDTPIDLPQIEITLHEVDREKMSLFVRKITAAQAIEDLTYELLGDTHGGWGNEDGAYGDVTFDVNEQSITLNFNERYTSTTHYFHKF
jgi:hypothetical protein